MKILTHCSDAIDVCLKTRRFAIARLSSDERARGMHIHDCLEIYYSISGDKQFIVGDTLYEASEGDLFVLNPYETHRPVCREGVAHERIVICVHPEYPQQLSTDTTDLSACFFRRAEGFSHRVRLNAKERKQFEALLERCVVPEGFGSDLLENARFAELMIMISGLFAGKVHMPLRVEKERTTRADVRVEEILAYLNERIDSPLTIDALAEEFYLSKGYICRLFKEATGTTINRYVIARRISEAKRLLSRGHSVHETCEKCGFGDYTHFIRAFGQAVGMSPKQYALNGTQ